MRRGPDGKPLPTNAGAQQQPIEIAVRATRNAIKRHAEGLKDDQVKLACRSLLIALHGNLDRAENPGEIFALLEQVQHVLHATRRDESQLPVAVRAVVGFATETPARQREVGELVRQLLRHLYALSSDFIPRQARDDGRFRAEAVLDLMGVIAREYLSDKDFDALRA
ncbi:MAG: hypothetical protein JWM25_1974 [Thermoleophilia bacterium]|nr:hypothetical protein [Thermoleophilia bacterium]